MKKGTGLYIVLCVLLMVLLFLPLLQQAFHPFKLQKLHGATEKVEPPQLSFSGYKDQSYQAQLERYVSANFGFHEPVIRLYNQYLWLYRKTYSQDVIVGKDKWLYGKRSVYDHYRQVPYWYADSNEALEAMFEKDLDRLKKVQRLLEERGTKLFVMICPGKDIICPEHLPDNGNFVMSDGLRAIDWFPQAFADNGIHCLNMNAWFEQIKDTVSYPLFPKTGMHWSNVACAQAADTIIRYMEWLTGKNMPNVKAGPVYGCEAVRPDDDLEKTMNLLWRIRPNENYYSDVHVIPDTSAQRLRLITIGDSFFWNIAYTLPMDSIFSGYPYWYYYSTIYFDSEHTKVKQLDLVKELERADIVMLLSCANTLYEINRGFLSRALVKLSSTDPDIIESIRDQIKQNMMNDSTWRQGLMEKAERKGKTLEQVMDEDALWLIEQNPEKYLSGEEE